MATKKQKRTFNLTDDALRAFQQMMFHKLKLWDYSDNRMNLHGRVCLLYSVFWTTMAVVFTWLIHPVVSMGVSRATGAVVEGVSIALVVYFVTDFVFSSTMIYRRAR